MQEIQAVIGQNGRVVVPSEYRKKLGLSPGDKVLLILDAGGIRIIPTAKAVFRAQELVRRYIPGKRKLSDELIFERREEAKRE